MKASTDPESCFATAAEWLGNNPFLESGTPSPNYPHSPFDQLPDRFWEGRKWWAYPRDEYEFIQFGVWIFDPTKRELYFAIIELVFQFLQSTGTCEKSTSVNQQVGREMIREREVSTHPRKRILILMKDRSLRVCIKPNQFRLFSHKLGISESLRREGGEVPPPRCHSPSSSRIWRERVGGL